MTLQWSVVVLDKVSNPGMERQQDLVQVQGVDMQASAFRPTTSPKPTASTLRLSFPVDTPDLHIAEMMQVWAGWRDDGSAVWSNVDPDGGPAPVWGGRILRIDGETVEGGEKTFQLTLCDYGLELTKTDVLGWPTFVTAFPTNPAAVGYPAAYSVADWLIGDGGNGTGYVGVVPMHLGNGVKYDGVDPIFTQILFTADVLPGTLDPIQGVGTIQGYFGGGDTTVDSVVKALADAALFAYTKNYSGPELVIGYWMRAVIGDDPTRIVPQFNFRNVADLETVPDFTVATDATGAEWQMLAPHKHERDATDVRTVVNLFGLGGDVTLTGNPLVYASYQHPDHAAIYPTDYQIDPVNGTPGWGGGPIFEPRLHTRALATFLAQTIENRVWGAKGSQECYIERPTTAGERCRWRDTNESIDRIYIVTEADGPDAEGLYHIRVGFTQRTINDMVRGGLSDVLLTREDLAWKQGTLTSRTMPGTGKQIPVELAPTHPARNHVTAGYNDTPALVMQGSTQDRDPSAPTDPAAYVHVFQVKPPSTAAVPDPAPGTWATLGDGRPHPNALHAGTFVTDASFKLTFPVYQIQVTAIDLEGTGSVVLLKDSVPVTGTLTGPGRFPISPAVPYNPRSGGTPAEWIGITTSGTSSGDPLGVVIWEK